MTVSLFQDGKRIFSHTGLNVLHTPEKSRKRAYSEPPYNEFKLRQEKTNMPSNINYKAALFAGQLKTFGSFIKIVL